MNEAGRREAAACRRTRKGAAAMDGQKVENLLNLAMGSTQREKEKSQNLMTGYNENERTWELIIRYDQSRSPLPEELAEVIPLSFGYGIIRVPEREITKLAALEEVEYIEKPKRLYFSVNQGRAASCFTGLPASVETGRALDGSGTIVAVLDTGVDYFHPDFRREDGSTRILALWDQTLDAGMPPEGFRSGTEFTGSQLNAALEAGRRDQAAGYKIVPSRDTAGHGTQVLGIAAGNGRASGGIYAGGAPGSDILAVKLGTLDPDGFPGTAQLMQAVEYVLRKAMRYRQPVVINLSFGNVYGSQDPCQ